MAGKMRNTLKHVKTTSGFTLVELLIVVAIIGILAAIAVPSFKSYIARSQVTEAIQLAAGLKTLVAETYSHLATCPNNTSTSTSYGISISSDIKGKYVLSVTTGGPASPSSTGDCTITALMRPSGIAPGLENKSITYTMRWSTSGAGAVSWACSSTIPAYNLPSSSCTSS